MAKYGRKIKRSKNLYYRKKSSLRKTLEIIGMFAVVGGLVFLGYAAGKPLVDFLTSGAPAETEESLKWTPPVSDAPITSAPVSEEVTTATEQEEPADGVIGGAVAAPSAALSNSASLAAFLQLAKSEGYTTVVAELKDDTGNVWYKSEISEIRDTEIIKGTLTLKEIMTAFRNAGLRPAAKINTLKDHVAPKIIPGITYRFADDSYAWWDDDPNSGGKPWANPFLDGTKNYISALVDEAAKAGFADIILSNNIFPPMRPADYGFLSAQVTDENTRYNGLISFLEACAAKKGESTLTLEVSVKDIVEGRSGGYAGSAEILRGSRVFESGVLSGVSVLAAFNRSETGAEIIVGESTVKLPENISALTAMLFKQAERNLSGITLIPCVIKSGLSEAEFEEVKTQLSLLGYENYIIK